MMLKRSEPLEVSSASPQVKINNAITQLSGFSSDSDLEASLSQDTNAESSNDEKKPKQRRKRRTKDEMALARGDNAGSDERYEQAVQRMNAFGGARTAKAAFVATGRPLDEGEQLEMDDLFYVASKKWGLDPSGSPWLMSLYALLLFARLVVVRAMDTSSTNIWSQFSGLFDGKKDKPDGDKGGEDTVS